jgi:hypothetical protein
VDKEPVYVVSVPHRSRRQHDASRTKGYVVGFSELVQYFRRLKGTSGRNAWVEILVRGTCASTHA